MNNPLFFQTSPAVVRWLKALRWLGLAALVALMLTPLVLDPGARDDSYFTPKWVWISVWTAVGAAALIGRALAGRAAVVPFHPAFFLLLLVPAWSWISCAWAPSRSLALDRTAHLAWLTLAVWVGVNGLRSRRGLMWMARLAVGVGLVTALWVLLEDAVRRWAPGLVWIRPNLSDWRGFLAAGLGNTNHLGDLLALTFMIALMGLGEPLGRADRVLAWTGVVLLPLALIVCYSVGSNLGLVGGALVMLFLTVRHLGWGWFTRRKWAWAAAGAAWALAIVFLNTDQPLNPHRPGILKEGFASGRWAEGGPTRLAIWAQALEMIRLHPTLGVGAGNFTYVFPEMDSQLIADRPDLLAYQGLWTNAAHNELLQSWAEQGAVGLFLFIVLLAACFYGLLKGLDEAPPGRQAARILLTGLLVAWVLHAQMNFVFQHPAGMLSLMLIVLAIIVEDQTGGPYEPMPPLCLETDWFAVRVDWKDMRHPFAAGGALLLPGWLAIGLGAAALLATVAFVPWHSLRPVLAQRAYKKATQAAAMPALAEQYYQRAFELYPQASDCRSNYSQWLLDHGRPAECLDQLAIVRERLNSNELWVREAQAQRALGLEEQARQSMQTYYDRVWLARQRQ